MHLNARSHRKGQTLVEFALTLPILLLLIFGIIEFGRIFQAWVSLQNAARAAARYASTGQVNYDLFTVNNPTDPIDIEVLNQFVPCYGNDGRGNRTTNDGYESYENGANPTNDESFFANWYDGTDCDPNNEDHQQMRRDMLRLPGIMFEARESANALGVEWKDFAARTHYYEDLTPVAFRELLYSYQRVSRPREYQSGYFDLTICSTRGLLDPINRDNPTLNPQFPTARFVLVRTRDDLNGVTMRRNYDPLNDGVAFPFCMLNEIPPPPISGDPADNPLNNSGLRWIDAGGPGERVNIVVTFNHPLITPLRLPEENYIRMQARRSIVNESFRAPKAVGAFQRSLPKGSGGGSNPQPTWTPIATNTPTHTPEPSHTPTNTLTPTREAFRCDRVRVNFALPPFTGNQLFMQVFNDNFDQTQLLGYRLEWRVAPTFPDMYLGVMGFRDESEVFWTGAPADSRANTALASKYVEAVGGAINITPNPLPNPVGQWLPVPTVITAQNSVIMSAVFFNGPANITDLYENLDNIAGLFVLDNPIQGQPDCLIYLPLSELPPLPPTPTPQGTPTPTPTPQCVRNDQMQLRFGGYNTSNRSAFFVLTNTTTFPARLVGFALNWPDGRTHNDIPGDPVYGLDRVVVIPPGGSSTGQTIWDPDGAAPNDADYTGLAHNQYNTNYATYAQDNTYPRPAWATGLTQAPGWITETLIGPGEHQIVLDFTGTGDLRSVGFRDYHFNNSRFIFGCRSGGGGGGGGGGSVGAGDIQLPLPSPSITNTPLPTNTRGPTHTPAPATATRTPTRTRTPMPPSVTPTPRTPTLTPSRTPFGQPTQPPGGGGE
ncbi:MAG: pilus assembly protein [Anaerolineae bacterium]|nr:pilus assembly protein [Anaerolineae bacterium]